MSIAVLEKLQANWNIDPSAKPGPGADEQLSRLEELIHGFGFRPHLNLGGGSGFTWPKVVLAPHNLDDLISEFARLWFSPVGWQYISEHEDSLPHQEFVWPSSFYNRPGGRDGD